MVADIDDFSLSPVLISRVVEAFTMKSAQFDFVFATPSSATTSCQRILYRLRQDTDSTSYQEDSLLGPVTSSPQAGVNELSQRFSDALGVSSSDDSSTNTALPASRPRWDVLRSRRRGPKPWNDEKEAGSGETNSQSSGKIHEAHNSEAVPKPVPRTLMGSLGGSQPIPLQLVAFNSDVLDYMLLWLSRGSLAALMATCHYFFEVILPVLCKRLREPIRFSWQFLSFYTFLRAKSHSPRWTMIQDLHLDVSASANILSSDIWHHFLGYAAGNNISSIMYHALHLCRNLRRLYLVHCFDGAQDFQPAVRAISAMSSLEELSIQGINSVTVQQIQQIVKKKPCLRALAIYGVLIELSIPDILDHLRASSATLVELDLRSTFLWTVPVNVVFRCIRKLTIGPPEGWDFREMARVFPGLLHLKIALERARRWDLHGRPRSEGDVRRELEVLRQFHREHWQDHPDQRPSLESLSSTDPCALYALAAPRTSRISLPYTYCDTMPVEQLVEMYQVVLSEAAPSWVELRLLSALRPNSSNPEWGPACPRALLRMLDACKASIRRCTIIIADTPQTSRWFSDTYLCVLDALQYGVQGVPLSYLFVTFEPGNIRATKNAYQNLREKALETASSLAKLCATLSWVGFYFPSEVLRSWEVNRGASRTTQGETEQVIELKELDVEQGWAVVQKERLLGDI
ncbi:hypothetical protein GY45DRAFT_1433048 [Cubamyces sp. BRFM 1775]|nr:hypothetical protein GY45DRAFT_1433048 [Cubamyces sp. BRFM 1775]